MTDLRHPVVSTLARGLERWARICAGKFRAAAGDLLEPEERESVEELRRCTANGAMHERQLALKVLGIIDKYLGDPLDGVDRTEPQRASLAQRSTEETIRADECAKWLARFDEACRASATYEEQVESYEVVTADMRSAGRASAKPFGDPNG